MAQDTRDISSSFPQPIHSVDRVLVHYGELALKGRNRGRFEDKLINNIASKLKDNRVSRIQRLPGRIIASFDEPLPWKTISDQLKDVFGISSISQAWVSPPDMAKLEETVLKAIADRRFRTFAVRTKRTNKGFPLTSEEINKRIGAAINNATSAKVDLEEPEETIWIEILDKELIISAGRVRGYYGLPSGTSGRVLTLLSGGIDSPVAAWRMMRRGCEVFFLHFHSSPFTNKESEEKAVELATILGRFQPKTRLATVPLSPIQGEIITNTPARYRVILYRRFMMRIAERIARGVRAKALVTGESLGQVASQTIPNLITIESVASLPILRPLIGMDKDEIIKTAVEIGTYKVSIEPHQDCCSFLQPRSPAIKTTPEELEEVERALDIGALVSRATEAANWQDIIKIHPCER